MLLSIFKRQKKQEEVGKIKLIVGLGNPGKQYEHTRHNIGFDVIDLVSAQFNIPLNQGKLKGLYGIGGYQGTKVLLLKPLTYMNLSGESVRAVIDYYQVDLEDVLVIYDDLDLPVGKIRLRQKGSPGGHNGIKSIAAHLGTQQFNRIRIGIDRPAPGMNIPDYVLGKFHQEEQGPIDEAARKSADACEAWLSKPFIEVMNDFNQ